MADNLEDRGSVLDAFARIDQPTESRNLSPIAPTAPLERIVGAQQVAVKRDEQAILQRMKLLSSAAGSEYYYRFPVKTKDGKTEFIEGPSIKLANDLARTYGNCLVDTRVVDLGDSWLIYATFIDYETGFAMSRPFQQRKGQTSMKTRNAERQLDIAFQIGTSKSIRNIVVNALQTFADFAFDEARNSLVDKIGKDLNSWRDRTLQGLAKIPVELARAERVIGRAAKDWLAPDIAHVIAMMKSIADGMATADETFPPIEEVASPSGTPSGGVDEERTAGADQHVDDKSRRPSDPDVEQQQENPADIAYHRGVEARAAGSTAKALPGEYRDQARTREALAWHAGFDGQPKPETKP